MKLEHIVLNNNKERGYIREFQDNTQFIEVTFDNQVVGKTEIGSNQHKVRVFINNSDDCVILDNINNPVTVNKSSLTCKLDAKGYKETLINEKNRRLQAYQDACRNNSSNKMELFSKYDEILKLI